MDKVKPQAMANDNVAFANHCLRCLTVFKAIQLEKSSITASIARVICAESEAKIAFKK